MKNMKPSGIKWVGDIPYDWECKKIKYISTLKGRIGWQGLTSDEYTDQGPYLITGIDFLNGHIDWQSCVHVPIKRWEEAKEIQITNGDLLITKDGTVGKVAIVDKLNCEASLNSGILRIITEKEYNRRFLYWVLQSDVFWNWFNYKNSGNSTIIHLYQKDFEEFKYAVPKGDEQQKIAEYLSDKCSKIDLIIDDMEQQIQILQKFKKSLITETVTMREDYSKVCEKRIKYILKGIKDGTHGTFDRVDEGYPLLSAKNVFEDGLYISSNESEISEKDYKSIVSNDYPQKDDVLLCCVGTVGRCGIYNLEKPHAFQRSVVFLRCNELILPRMLFYCLQTDKVLVQEQNLINKSAQDGLYMGSIKEIKIEFPLDICKQQEIINYLDKKCSTINKILVKKQQLIKTMKQYKKSLIYEYVTGKKRV